MQPRHESMVVLRGGPHDGAEVPRPDGRTFIATGDGVPEGMCARYRRTRDADAYRFDGWDRIVVSLPLPGGSDA